MHGRLKVRTTEEQKHQKHKGQQHKLAAYRMGMKQILSTRQSHSYDDASVATSAQLLLVNPDIYTLWNYRKEVVLIKKTENSEAQTEFTAFLEDELKLTQQCLMQNPKSYGSWYHRYWILAQHPEPNWQQEFDLCSQYLSKDERNFHCWDYRRLIVGKIGIRLMDEVKFTTAKINENFSNYSSWHYRSTLRNLTEENVESELMLVQNAVFTDPEDSSPWFYLRWVLSNKGVTQERRVELLRTLNELLDLDPECKWILIGKCWLHQSLSSIDDNVSQQQCLSNYRELISLDKLRKGHYEDKLKIIDEEIANNM